MRPFIIFILFFTHFLPSFSQKKCGTDEYHELINQRGSFTEDEEDFERWLKSNILRKKSQRAFSTEDEGTIYTIPVVVHVIHQGEEPGAESNIPDEQIFSQIEVLNEDFRRMNADASQTPDEFLPVAADVRIEFVLAKRDPEGLPTTGIVRKTASRDSYHFNTDRELKSQSYWPAEDYLNLWVTILSGNLLGYAQFPTSNLEGMDIDQSIDRLTDGIVVDYRFMGEGHNALAFSTGRTATHEIGHFLGLRHIWGSGGCSSDDFCEDTPNQSGSTLGCPDGTSETSCDSKDMYQNYLDLSDDVCMNLFTICQKDRMRTILENSPRRKSLLASKGKEEAIQVANDLGIRQILSPVSGDCQALISPQIEVRNYGTNTIEGFGINLYVNDIFIESVSKNTIISELSTSVVSFSEISVTAPTTAVYRFEIIETNGAADGNPENNVNAIEVNFPGEEQIPYTQDFEGSLDQWAVQNSAGNSPSWSKGQAPYNTLQNEGMVLSYHSSPDDRYGELDLLISPVFDLSALPSADISVKYAYAASPGNITDVFTIAISTDCGNTFPTENYIFHQFSPRLATTNQRANAFVPEGPGDWEILDINITEFVGNENVVVAFIGHNGGGNNLYIDDFSITSENKLDYDLTIKDVNQIPAVTCSGSIFPTIEVKNQGTQTITDFTLSYNLDGSTVSLFIDEINLLPGKSHIEKLNINNILKGDHEIDIHISDPNGNIDQNPENDEARALFIVNDAEETNPLRENFENEELITTWSVVRPDAAHNWSLVEAVSSETPNNAMLVDGFNIPELGIDNWLVSPVLDLTVADEASVSFKVSYANVPGRNDRLKVLVSLNCGRNYDHTVYDKNGEDLAIVQQTTEWSPTDAEHWKTEFIDLSEFAIWPEVRIAFVVTNQNGNNLYIDDIEFYQAADPNLLDIENELLRVYPNPASTTVNMKFDLPTKSNLTIRMIDLMGRVVHEGSYPGTLNQTYTIENLQVDNGIYLLHVSGAGNDFSRRVIVWN